MFTIGTEQIYKTTFGWRIDDDSDDSDDDDFCEIDNDSFITNYRIPDEDLGAMDPDIQFLYVVSGYDDISEYPTGFNSI